MANCPVCRKKLGLSKRQELMKDGVDLVLIQRVQDERSYVYAITPAAYKHMLEARARGQDWDPIPGALKLGELKCHVPLTEYQAGELLHKEGYGCSEKKTSMRSLESSLQSG